MELKTLIDSIRSSPNCMVKPADTKLESDVMDSMPDDLQEFYTSCNGLILFKDEPYEFEIVGKGAFERANPAIVGEPCAYDISYDWYIIAKGNSEQYITIDLNEERKGRCYDSFWETHGLREQTPIIANSFTELLNNLCLSKGQSLYWLEADFQNLGDAYDGIPED